MDTSFFSSLVRFQMNYPDETFAIAVSGGVDSMALLHWMHKSGAKCIALTVDHKLREESSAEAKRIGDICAELGIKHKILEWNADKPQTGIEEAARIARYSLMLDFCKKNNIGVLVTAHQADDQIETFLMNLGRGSGIYGLAGIRETQVRDGIIIFRPMLTVRRTEIKKYCDENNIGYFDDKMNHDEKFLRVKIRKNRFVLSQSLGISDDRILSTIHNLARARDFIEHQVSLLVSALSRDDAAEFDAQLLLGADDEVKLRALSILLQKIGELSHPCRLADIKRALEKLRNNSKFTLGRCNIRRLGNKIRIWKEGTKWQK